MTDLINLDVHSVNFSLFEMYFKMTTPAMSYIFLWIILSGINNARSFSTYKSCKDVLTEKGQNATDGEYILFLENGIGVSIYCHGKLIHNKQ